MSESHSNTIPLRSVLILGLAAVVGFGVLVGCAPLVVKLTPGVSHVDRNELGSATIYVEEFVDVRGVSKPRVVGQAMLGFFNVLTPVKLEDPVERAVTWAVSDALSHAGFRIVYDRGAADLIVKGRINTLWVQEKLAGLAEHTEGEVELDLAIFSKKTDKPIWFDVKNGRARSKDTSIDVTSENEKILNQALEEAITAFVNDKSLHVAVSEHHEPL